MEPTADFNRSRLARSSAAAEPPGRTGNADDGERRSLLLPGQCREPLRRLADPADLRGWPCTPRIFSPTAGVSPMLDERAAGDPLEGARIMLAGRAVEAAPSRPICAGATSTPIHLRKPLWNLRTFRSSGSHLFAAHLVAGFGRIIDLSRSNS